MHCLARPCPKNEVYEKIAREEKKYQEGYWRYLVRTVIDGIFASLHIAENLFRTIQPAAILATSRSLPGDDVLMPPSVTTALKGESGMESSDSGLLQDNECFLPARESREFLHEVIHDEKSQP